MWLNPFSSLEPEAVKRKIDARYGGAFGNYRHTKKPYNKKKNRAKAKAARAARKKNR